MSEERAAMTAPEQRATDPAGDRRGTPPPLVRLVVIIPALDEERTVGDVIRRIPADLPGVDRVDVVVVNDGSTDRTARVAAEAGAFVLHHGTTSGVGRAFQTGLEWALDRGADLIVNMDGDGQFDPADIAALIAPVIAGRADFATASRFKDPALTPKMPAVKVWGNRQMSRLISTLTGQRFYDVSCGMRCYSRAAALRLNLIGRFTYTQEVFLNMAFKNFQIVEVPIRVRGEREFGKSRVASNLFNYAFKTARIIFLCYRDYHPLRFFGGLAAALTAPALVMWGVLGVHYLRTGEFTPYKSLGFIGAALILIAAVLLHLGIIGDMLNRHRIYLEELLYRQRAAAGGTRRDERRWGDT